MFDIGIYAITFFLALPRLYLKFSSPKVGMILVNTSLKYRLKMLDIGIYAITFIARFV